MQPENSNMQGVEVNQNTMAPQTLNVTEQAETQKKSSNPLLFVVIILAVLVIGLGVGLVVMIGQNNSANEKITKLENELEELKKDAPNTAEAELKRIEEEQKRERNIVRQNDVSRLLMAANSFQANNSGKLPFSDGSVDGKFIERYVDSECTTSDGLSYRNCSTEFKDPSGEIYGFSAPIVVESDMDEALTDLNKMDYKFHVFINAECDGENAIELGSGQRQVAIMMKLEGGSVVCNDNH